MTSQIGVSDNIGLGQAGTPADDVTIRTGKVDTARIETSALEAGLFVIKGTDDDQVEAPALIGDVVTGLLVHRDNNERDLRVDTASPYPVDSKAGQAIDGVYWAFNEGAVVKGTQVFVRYESGAGGSTIGIARADVDTASATAQNATFHTSNSASGICQIRLHFEQV